MEEVDKGCPLIRMGVSGCFFWYQPTRVVPDQGPLKTVVCGVYVMLAHSLLCVIVFFSDNI